MSSSAAPASEGSGGSSPGHGGRYAVVGAGVAGLVAGWELRRAGHQVVVFECSGTVSGRTLTLRFCDDHLLDAGAAWLTSFYRRALRYAAGLPMLDRDVSGTPRLRRMDRPGQPVVPAPFGPAAVARSPLLTTREKARLVAWVLGNAARRTHVGPRAGARQRHDDSDAARYARDHLGEGVLQCLLRPAFETMVFAPVADLSAAFVGNWAGAALTASYCVPAGGMDAPWRRLAAQLEVRLHHEVVSVVPASSGRGVDVAFRLAADPTTAGSPASDQATDVAGKERFDGAVVAVPAPVAARIIPVGQAGRPPWLGDVRYARHVFAYGARPRQRPAGGVPRSPSGAPWSPGGAPWSPSGPPRSPSGVEGQAGPPMTHRSPGGAPRSPSGAPRSPSGAPRSPSGAPWSPSGAPRSPSGVEGLSRVSDIHPVGPGEHRIGSVQLLRGGDGRVPPGWEAAMVSATGPWSENLLSRYGDPADRGELFDLLWREGSALEPELWRAADCEVREVVRWFDAVPIFGPGHLTRLATWHPSAPVALAGDWSWYPCVEGAVISGQRAATALLVAV